MGLPPEIANLFQQHPAFANSPPELLVAFPEWKVPLPGGRADGQSDVFALVRCNPATVALAVEGKVAEPFGPTLGEWLIDASDGKRQRLDFIKNTLGLANELPDTVRYQFLHRTASALIEANRFGTDAAAMAVHSFSSDQLWFNDFTSFCALFGAAPKIGQFIRVTDRLPRPLYLGWAVGEKRFLAA